MKNVGKRNGIEERQSGLERERFEPFQQHQDLNSLLNRFAESASQLNDRSYYNVQTPDYLFDETNAIDTKQRIPTRFQNFQSNNVDSQADPFNGNPDDSAQAWYEEKQHSLRQQQPQQRQQQQQKQQPLNGHKSHYLRQWNQQITDKTDPAQQQQKQQPLKSFDNNGDFMQSLDLN